MYISARVCRMANRKLAATSQLDPSERNSLQDMYKAQP